MHNKQHVTKQSYLVLVFFSPLVFLNQNARKKQKEKKENQQID